MGPEAYLLGGLAGAAGLLLAGVWLGRATLSGQVTLWKERHGNVLKRIERALAQEAGAVEAAELVVEDERRIADALRAARSRRERRGVLLNPPVSPGSASRASASSGEAGSDGASDLETGGVGGSR